MSQWIQEFQFSLPAAPERVFAALTDPTELVRWFADEAEIEPRAGGSFRFWGRSSYETPDRARATQTLLHFEPPTALTFGWRLHGLDSRVELELAPDPSNKNPGGTRLTGRHRFPVAPPVDRPRDLVDDLWKLSFGNLLMYLRGGEGIVHPDFTDPAPEIRLSIRIDAPRERVFRALLDPATLNRWIASAAEVEPRVGGRYVYGWRYPIGDRQVDGGPTRILELVENEKLVTDWPDWRGDDSVPAQTITWLLEADGAGTRVTVVHSGFVRAADWSDYPFGWPEFLSALRAESEGRSGA